MNYKIKNKHDTGKIFTYKCKELKHLTDSITADLQRDITRYRQLRRDYALLSYQ